MGVSYDVPAWTAEWYIREDTLREADTVIVNHHYNLPLAGVLGGGTMSSSDGQRFPVRGKSLTGRNMVIHGGQVLSTYTHVSDQWPTYETKIIVPTAREAHYVLDDFLGNATDLPITEHATDTHGATLINFALFDNISFFGVIDVDVEAELAELDGFGRRPLRPAQLRQLGLTP